MSHPAVARFESGGAIPTLPVLERVAHTLEADLGVHVNARTHVA